MAYVDQENIVCAVKKTIELGVAREIRVGTHAGSTVNQERTGTATQSHTPDRFTGRQGRRVAASSYGRTEDTLHSSHKLLGGQAIGKITYHAASHCSKLAIIVILKNLDTLQSKTSCHNVRNTLGRVIHSRVA